MSRNTARVCTDCGESPCECITEKQLQHPANYTERSFFCERCGMSHNGPCTLDPEE